ncbi:MAG: hypothetical protein IPO06_30840 [Leptospiraceae bacterium]|nr:hypothetical protein [Leptospiraceae bacterium]
MKRRLLFFTILLLGSCYHYIIDKKKLNYKLHLEHTTGVIVYLNEYYDINENLIQSFIGESMQKMDLDGKGKFEIIGIYKTGDKIFDEAYDLRQQKKRNIIEIELRRRISPNRFSSAIFLLSAGVIPYVSEKVVLATINYYDSEGKKTLFARELLLDGYPVSKYFMGWIFIPFAIFSEESEITLYQHSFEYNLTEFTKKIFAINKSQADYELSPLDSKIKVQLEITRLQFGGMAGIKLIKQSWDKKNKHMHTRKIEYGCSTEDLELMCVGGYFHLRNKTGKKIDYSPDNYAITVNGREYRLQEAYLKGNHVPIAKDYVIELLPDNYGSFFITFLIPRTETSIKLNYRDKKAVPSILYETELRKDY